MNTIIRLVRCPRCRKVLPEPPEVPVYKCGGCGASLQAKKRKIEDSSGKRKIEHVSDEQEAGNISNHSINESDRKSDQDTDKAKNSTIDAPSGRVKDYSSGKQKIKQVSDDQEACSSSNQQSLVNSIDEPDRNRHHNDPRSSTELSGHENPESSPEATVHNRIDQEQEQDQDEDHNQDAAEKKENVVVDAKSGGFERSSSDQRMEQLSDDQEASSSSKQQLLVNSIDEQDRNSDHDDPRSSTEVLGHENPELSPEATAHNRLNQEHEHDHDQDENHYQDAAKKHENVMVDATSENGVERSSSNQKMEQLSDDQEAGSSSSELLYHEDPESSPGATVYNSIDQDYDQDQDYEESSRELTASPEKYSFSEHNEIEAIANKKIVRDSDGGSSSFKSMIAEKLLDTRKKKMVYQDEDDILSEDGSADLFHRRRFDRINSIETLESTRFGGTNYYGYEGSVSSFGGNDNQIPRKNFIGSKGRRHEFHPLKGRRDKDEHRSTDVRSLYGNSRQRPPVIPGNPKMERLELLKMVRVLQDQLERTNVSNSAKHVPSYYNHVLKPLGRNAPRMAFSGEVAAANRRRDGGSCYHCCPQDQHFSAQLPRQHLCCNGPHYVPSTCYSSHCSGPSSPLHHLESEFSVPVRSKPEPNVQRHKNDSPNKRYVRPISAGTPWITCYLCSELLQLPQSFLVMKKRYHSLRCGACLKVLNFMLSNGTHLHRYYPEETIAAPPSSEVEDYPNSTVSRAGPVSCSDRSFQKSYSTETDRNGSLELSEERRRAAMSRDPSASTRPASKILNRRRMTSEIEEIEPESKCSPLHRLMGYASPSKVIRG